MQIVQARARRQGEVARAVPTGLRPKVPAALVLIAPSLLILAAFTYGPLAQVLWRSLSMEPIGFSWSHYRALFADPHFARAAWNNVAYAIVTIGVSLPLALALAVALQASGTVRAAIRTLFVLPMMIPLVAAAALFSFVLLPGGGLLDHHLALIGVRGANYLGDPAWALPSVMAITIWKNAGYYMLFFLAGLAGVDRDLVAAARLDGAREWAAFRHVTLPMMGPTFGFVLPIALLNALTQVDQVVTLTQGGPSDSTNLILYYIYQQAEQNHDTGLASAATVVGVGALLALSLLSMRVAERGIHYES